MKKIFFLLVLLTLLSLFVNINYKKKVMKMQKQAPPKKGKFKPARKTYSQADRYNPQTGKSMDLYSSGKGVAKGKVRVTDPKAYEDYLKSQGATSRAAELSRQGATQYLETGFPDKTTVRTGPLYKLTGGRVGRKVEKVVEPGEVSVTKKNGKTKVIGDKTITTKKLTKFGKNRGFERVVKRVGQTSKRVLKQEANIGTPTPGLDTKVTTGSGTQTTTQGNRFGRGRRITGSSGFVKGAGYANPSQSTFAAKRKENRAERKQKRK